MQGTGYQERIRVCRRADLSAFAPWFVGDAAVGRVHRSRLALLRELPAFAFERGGFRLAGGDFASRSAAMADAVGRLHRRGELRAPLGEMYPVAATGAAEPLLQIDRAAVTWFGVPASGVHLNGFVVDRGLHLWIAVRASGKRTFPGHLDNVVAGGQSIGWSERSTLEKECAEEAAIPPGLAASAQFVGTIRYEQQDGLSLKVDSLACYDLALAPSFMPVPNDGEVDRFERLPLDAVAASLRGAGVWKPNSALVTLHFLLRSGALDREVPAEERWRLWRHLHGELP